MKQLFGNSEWLLFQYLPAMGIALGKSKCGTVWNAAQRNGITGYSCCAVPARPGWKLVSAV